MYESFDHLRVKVVSMPSVLGPYETVSSESATYSRILDEALKLAHKLNDNDDLLSDYLYRIGVNPQSSFYSRLEDRIFEYLLRIRLRPYGIELRGFVETENGMADLDELTFFIK